MFPKAMLFEPLLIQLASEVAHHSAPELGPLPCHRWLARSCLQKAIRRGEIEVAQRAFANLLAHDSRAAWRHLVVIALEDVGVPAFELVAQIILIARDRRARLQLGGDWVLGSFMVRQMAESVHCQAVCDLLLCSLNDPAWDGHRTRLLEAPVSEILSILANEQSRLPSKGIAALAIGGGLAEGQNHRDPALVFEALADFGYSPALVEIAHAAWRISRNPMALLLPLVRRSWLHQGHFQASDDLVPQAEVIGGVPEYAIDQFTRVGRRVITAYLREDVQLQAMLAAACVPAAQRATVVGDLIFLLEGTCLQNRVIWKIADELRCPRRALSGVFMLEQWLEPALLHLNANRAVITALRWRYLTPELVTSAPGQRQ